MEIKIGRLLKEQRQKYKLELKDVSRGLCAERSLNRYESDERFPDKMLADRLFGRIGIKVNKYEMLINDKDFIKVEFWSIIEDKMNKKEYTEALQMLNNPIYDVNINNISRQRVLKIQADIYRYENKVLKAIDKYIEALQCTCIDMNKGLNDIKCVDLEELEILFRLTTAMENAGKDVEDIYLYISDFIEKTDIDDNQILDMYIDMLYMKAIQLQKLKKYRVALKYVNQGININKKYRKLYYMGELLQFRCDIEKELGEKNREFYLNEYRQVYALLLYESEFLQSKKAKNRLKELNGKEWEYIK